MKTQSEQAQVTRESEQPAEDQERAISSHRVAERVFQELVTQLEPEVAEALRALRELQQGEAEMMMNQLRRSQP